MMYQIRIDSLGLDGTLADIMIATIGLTVMAPAYLKGSPGSIEFGELIRPPGDHNGAVADLVTGAASNPINGAGAYVEIADGRVVALWDLGMGRSPKLPKPVDDIPIADAVAERALTYIQRYRDRHAQRRLDPVVSGWTNRDLVLEAQRLGWDGRD